MRIRTNSKAGRKTYSIRHGTRKRGNRRREGHSGLTLDTADRLRRHVIRLSNAKGEHGQRTQTDHTTLKAIPWRGRTLIERLTCIAVRYRRWARIRNRLCPCHRPIRQRTTRYWRERSDYLRLGTRRHGARRRSTRYWGKLGHWRLWQGWYIRLCSCRR